MIGIEVLFTPGGVHELRALGVGGRERTDAGYFDDPAKLATTAAQMTASADYPALYFTLNPVDAALLARYGANAVKTFAKATTADHDVVARRWVVVDLDPVRPAGIPSTDAQHQAAYERALTITAHLSEQGWPAPVLIDSGNGYYLLHRVDLPNDNDARDLVKAVLVALAAKFDDAGVHVDQTMFNAARIIRIPGTMNRKGAGSADRPHRPAWIVSAPDPVQVVPVQLLQALAAIPAPVPTATPTGTRPTADVFMNPAPISGGYDLEGFLAQHLPDAKGPADKSGGQLWVLPVCPFNEEHNRGEAVVGRLANGAIYAKCQHNSCAWDWHALREHFDPAADRPSRRARTTPAGEYEGGADVSDSILAADLAADVLHGRYIWVSGLGWLAWTGQRWLECSDAAVGEPVRQWSIRRFAVIALTGNPLVIKAWQCILSLGKQRAALTLARGIVEVKAAELDAHRDLLNTPGGVVDMRTGKVRDHDPELYLTKITSGSYRPGYTHPDWEQALTALPDDQTQLWMQARIGQGATGHRSPDGVNVIMQGGGENGKGAIGSDGAVPALGDYACLASHKLIADTNEHSEEQATLRGKRLLIAEELTEGRALNVSAIKRISDVASITARHVHQRNMTFPTTHTLFATTNYIPVVNEVDHGTWRRLALVRFPYTFRKPHEELVRTTDRPGDANLKGRIEHNESGQHDAIVTWVVDGARRWYAEGEAALRPPESVVKATDAWRAEADRILGFWRAALLADRSRCILAEDMLEAFNAMIAENGHNRWSKELFTPRFASHMETTKHGVEARRSRDLPPVDRWTNRLMSPRVLQARESVWLGVRFRQSADDQDERGSWPECPESLETFSVRTEAGKFQTTLDTLASTPSQDRGSIDCGDCASLAKYGTHTRCYRHQAGAPEPRRDCRVHVLFHSAPAATCTCDPARR